MPQKLCTECKQQVINFFKFKKRSKSTDDELHKLMRSVTNVKMESELIADDVDELDIEGLIGCNSCDKQFRSDIDFQQHIVTDHPDEVLIEHEIEEDGDGTEAIYSDDVEDENNYMIIPIPAAPSPPPAASKRRRGRASTAEVQVQSFQPPPPAKKSKRAHKESEISQIFLDPNTDDSEIFDEFDEEMVYSVDDDYDDDDDSNPLGTDKFQCMLCWKSFPERIKYIEHCKSHDFSCKQCNRVFTDAEQLAAHMPIHEKNKRNYSEFIREDMFCMPCNRKLKSNTQVEQHYKMHDAVSMVINYMDFHPCHECQTIFVSEKTFNKHNNDMHAGKLKSGKPTVQSIKTAADDEEYLEEEFLEDENDYREGQYMCGECDTIYATARELKNHIILHQTKFNCPIQGCGCQYDQLSRLSIHIFHKHINAANLQCLHCEETFETYDQLQAHTKNDCREKKFQCHHCGKFQLFFNIISCLCVHITC